MTKKNVTMIIKYDFQIDTGETNYNGKILTFLMNKNLDLFLMIFLISTFSAGGPLLVASP